jgi:hypothetical protein
MGGKNSHTGPIWAVKQDRLLEALEHEENKIDLLLGEFKPQVPADDLNLIEGHLQEIKKTFKDWINLYHSLVLLTAAMRPPKDAIPATSNTPGVTVGLSCDQAKGEECIECGYELPAFELGDETNSFKFLNFDQEFKPESNHFVITFKDLFDENNLVRPLTKGGIRRVIAQKSKLSASTDLPLLQNFLAKSETLLLDLKPFNPANCLKTCRESFPRVRQENNVNCPENGLIQDYVDKAVDRIAGLWGEDINHLTRVQNWPEETKNSPNSFESWLRTTRQAVLSPSTAPRDLLDEAIGSDDHDIKLIIGGMSAMLRFNGTIFNFIYKRCFEASGFFPPVSFEELKSEFTANMTVTEKKQWSNLFTATYGIMAWQIFQQVSPTFQLLEAYLP